MIGKLTSSEMNWRAMGVRYPSDVTGAPQRFAQEAEMQFDSLVIGLMARGQHVVLFEFREGAKFSPGFLMCSWQKMPWQVT